MYRDSPHHFSTTHHTPLTLALMTHDQILQAMVGQDLDMLHEGLTDIARTSGDVATFNFPNGQANDPNAMATYCLENAHALEFVLA
jgi:hypothetical protein